MRTAIAAFLIGGITGTETIQAQQSEITVATMSLDAYKTGRDIKELKRAKASIDKACAHENTKGLAKTWKYKGDIYTQITFNQELKVEYPNAGYEAYQALMKGLDLDVAKLEAKGKPKHKIPGKSTYSSYFEAVSGALYNGGADAFGAKNYESAYNHFSSILDINPKTAFFTKTKIEFKFKEAEAARLAGVSAAKVGKMEEAEKLLMPSLEKGDMEEDLATSTYSLLANSYYDADKKDKAKEILAKARKQFPLNQGLLITEINYALSEGRLAELEEQLKQAVESDKNNVELIFVMGNMYDELFRAALEKGEEKEAASYFTKSINWYKKGLETKADHYNCAYSLGAIHVNYSNSLARKLNEMTDTRSDSYKKMNDEYNSLLKNGLESLLVAEGIKPSELQVLIALKEVYARLAEDDKFMEYKKKVEEAQGK